MDVRRLGRPEWAVAAGAGLLWVTGSLVVACGGKAVVDGTSGAGGQAGSSTTATSATVTTTGTTITTATTTPTPTTPCEEACLGLWNCTQQGDLCPGLIGASGDGFIDNCIDSCEQSPVLISLIIPNDCPATVSVIAAVSPEFATACYGLDEPMPDDEDP